MTKKYPLILIEWNDHESEDAWGNLDNTLSGAPAHINTVGWLIREDDKCYVVAATVAADGDGCQVIKILKGTVIQVVKLRVPRTKKT